VNARDAARLRVRRATGLFVAGSVAAAASLAAYIAGAASGHNAVTRTSTTVAATTPKRTTRVPVPGIPPAPALHASSDENATPQVPSVTPPAATEAPPVAVSGGS
jgi:hypothetical protein